MKTMPSLAGALCLAALTTAVPARATLDVEFVDPQNFTDINNHGPWGSLRPPQVLDILGRHLHALAERCLPADQTLELRVTDVQLAGELAGLRGYARLGDARLMREIDWPRVTLSWRRLDAQGAVMAERTQESVADMDYLHHIPVIDTDMASLPYERRMLSRWFDQRFCAR